MRTIGFATLRQCEELIRGYAERGLTVRTIEDGVLGLGVVILYNDGDDRYKNFVIEEYYLNTWSSGHRVKVYNNASDFPKKYLRMVEEYDNKDE